MKIKNVFIVFVVTLFAACSSDGLTDKINKTGDAAGQVVGEFASGVASGVEKAFEVDLELPQELIDKGLELGKVSVSSDSGGVDNKLIAYLIFNQNLKDTLQIKVYNKNGKEIGRTSKRISGRATEARYIEFIFDTHTNIDNDSKIVVE